MSASGKQSEGAAGPLTHAAYVAGLEDERDSLRSQLADARQALERVAEELQQSNGGKGPSSALNVFLLEFVTEALARLKETP